MLNIVKKYNIDIEKKINELIDSAYSIFSKKNVSQFITQKQREAIKIIFIDLMTLSKFKIDNVSVTSTPTSQYVHFNITTGKLTPPIYFRLNGDTSVYYTSEYISNTVIEFPDAYTAAKGLRVMIESKLHYYENR